MARDSLTPSPDEFSNSEEAELIAYMDGELEPDEMRRVEALLAGDPQLRAKAKALKKTYDLLEYLPKPEPSVDFATRTLDKLPLSKAGSHSGSAPIVPGSPSASAPLPLPENRVASSSSLSMSWLWALLFCAGIASAVGAGYFGTAAARRFLQQQTVDHNANPSGDEELPPERVVRWLPLYAVADDLEFVEHLANDPALFGDGLIGSSTASPVQQQVPWIAEMPTLIKSFQGFPRERQKQIVKLDEQLHSLRAGERDRLFGALEAYAVWLHRLPESERRGVLAAATPGLRLKVVRELRDAQAQERLPERIRSEPDATTRTAKIRQWETEEAERRRAWIFARNHWDAILGTRIPWPFDSEPMKSQVIEYAKLVYRFEEKVPRPRLLAQDIARLNEAYHEGHDKGIWLWFGWVLYDLTPRYDPRDSGAPRYEMLPRPAEGKPITDFSQLPVLVGRHYANKPQGKVRLERHVGRWPDFALAVHDDLNRFKVAKALPLGPARIADFAEPIRTVANRDLIPVLNSTEQLALQGLEGRWPEYPRYLIRVARAHDVSLPGTMLPGKPSDWERTYGGIPGRAAIRKGVSQ